MKSNRTRAKYRFEKTGRSEVVAGAPCEMWQGEYTGENGEKEEGDRLRGQGRRVRAGRTDVRNPMMRRGGPGQEQFDQFRELVGNDKGHPQGHQHQGRQVVTELEATKIERKVVE